MVLHQKLAGRYVGIPTLKKDGKLESENNLKAEILNDQFKSVFTQENPELPSNPIMPDIEVSVEGVTKLLRDINPNKASGPDEIPARILKLAAEEIAPALSVIFQDLWIPVRSPHAGYVQTSHLSSKKESARMPQITAPFL